MIKSNFQLLSNMSQDDQINLEKDYENIILEKFDKNQDQVKNILENNNISFKKIVAKTLSEMYFEEKSLKINAMKTCLARIYKEYIHTDIRPYIHQEGFFSFEENLEYKAWINKDTERIMALYYQKIMQDIGIKVDLENIRVLFSDLRIVHGMHTLSSFQQYKDALNSQLKSGHLSIAIDSDKCHIDLPWVEKYIEDQSKGYCNESVPIEADQLRIFFSNPIVFIENYDENLKKRKSDENDSDKSAKHSKVDKGDY